MYLVRKPHVNGARPEVAKPLQETRSRSSCSDVTAGGVYRVSNCANENREMVLRLK